MQDLIPSLAKDAGLPEDVTAKAAAIVLAFLDRDANAVAGPFLDRFPGARELIATRPPASGKGGLLAGLGAMLGGGGAIATFNELTSLGLDLDQIRSLVNTIILHARQTAGDEAVDAVLNELPAIRQIL